MCCRNVIHFTSLMGGRVARERERERERDGKMIADETE